MFGAILLVFFRGPDELSADELFINAASALMREMNEPLPKNNSILFYFSADICPKPTSIQRLMKDMAICGIALHNHAHSFLTPINAFAPGLL
jgi:hypothetical protein